MKNDITVGMDMGDKKHHICILNAEGEVECRTTVTNTAAAIRKYFGKLDVCRVALEAGTHSAWVSRILEDMEFEVLVGNPRKLRMIWNSDEKCDERDAEMLARIARFDPGLLYPIHHKGAEVQNDLSIIKSRDMLVKSRAMLITHVRGVVKSTGERIGQCSTEAFHKRLCEDMPKALEPALEPIMKNIEDLTLRIRHYDKLIEKVAEEKYPEVAAVRQITGVGALTAMAFVLTVENVERFTKSRDVGSFVGLTPRRDQSGQTGIKNRIGGFFPVWCNGAVRWLALSAKTGGHYGVICLPGVSGAITKRTFRSQFSNAGFYRSRHPGPHGAICPGSGR